MSHTQGKQNLYFKYCRISEAEAQNCIRRHSDQQMTELRVLFRVKNGYVVPLFNFNITDNTGLYIILRRFFVENLLPLRCEVIIVVP